MLDLRVVDIVETPEVVVWAQNASLDSKAKFIANNDIAAAKLENVLPVAPKGSCRKPQEETGPNTFDEAAIGLRRSVMEFVDDNVVELTG
jgi:hypothetical protein